MLAIEIVGNSAGPEAASRDDHLAVQQPFNRPT